MYLPWNQTTNGWKSQNSAPGCLARSSGPSYYITFFCECPAGDVKMRGWQLAVKNMWKINQMGNSWLLNSRDSMLPSQTLKFYFHDYAGGEREKRRRGRGEESVSVMRREGRKMKPGIVKVNVTIIAYLQPWGCHNLAMSFCLVRWETQKPNQNSRCMNE